MPAVTEPNILPSSPVLTLMTQISLETPLASSVMVLNSCASRSARRCLSASMRRLFGRVSGIAKPLRKQIIARVAGGDFDLVGFTAEADDVVGEDDFSFCHTKMISEGCK